MTLDDLPQTERELLRGLLRGASPTDLGWALGTDADEVMRSVHQALADLEPDAAHALGSVQRRRIGEYLLGRQSPGQAAGTWADLERSPEARRWAQELREQLTDLYVGEAPAIPGVKDLPSISPTAQAAGIPAGLGARRRERAHLREAQRENVKAAVDASPFRKEAIKAHRDEHDRIRLPHFASRPTRIALYALVASTLAALVFCAIVSVPTHTSARALVTNLPDGAPGPLRGLSIVTLFPPGVRPQLHAGQQLRVQLPDTEQRVSTRLAYVSDRTLSPEEIVRRFGLSRDQARRVRGPAAVAVADLKVPEDAPRRGSFEGSVTEQATLRTGHERILGLLL